MLGLPRDWYAIHSIVFDRVLFGLIAVGSTEVWPRFRTQRSFIA